MKAYECLEQFGYTFTGNPDAEVHPAVVNLMRNHKIIEQRRKVISASDIASAIGDNPHKPIRSLLRDKVFGCTFKGNVHTQHGQRYEPIACEKFCQQTGHTVFEFGLLPHPTIPFLAGSPDGVCADGSIIEIKCPLTRAIKNEVPVYYYPQVQIVLEIVDSPTEKGYFIQYKPEEINNGVEEFVITEVPRSRTWFQEKLPLIADFWNSVIHFREHPEELEPCMIDANLYEKKSIA